MVRPRQVSDDEILCVARACFLEHGSGVSVNVIAEQLGVSQAALFKRFGTKEQLLFAALAPPATPPWVAMLEAGPDERPIPEQLVELGLVLSRFFDQMTPCMSVLRAAGISPEEMISRFDTPPPVHGQRAVAGWLRRAQAQGRIRACDADTLAFTFIGALHVRAFMRHVAGRHFAFDSLEQHVERVIDTLWHGISP